MKTVEYYRNLGLVFVNGDFTIESDGSSNRGDSGFYVDRYFNQDSAFNTSKVESFAWRDNDGVKPEYRGVIEVRLNNTIELIGIYSDRPLWSRGYLNSVSKWRPVALIEESKSRIETILCDSSLGFIPQKNVTFNADRLSIDGRDYHASSHNPKFTVKEEKPKTTTTVNIEGREYLILSRTPAVSTKEDKPMKPVYTAEMHAKGELPPVGSEFYPIENEKDTQTCLGYTSKGKVVGECFGGGVVSLFFVNEIKPTIKTIKVNGFDVPAPMSEAPKFDYRYFAVDLLRDDLFSRYTWKNGSVDHTWLTKGIMHSTESAAIAHAKAMLSIDPNA